MAAGPALLPAAVSGCASCIGAGTAAAAGAAGAAGVSIGGLTVGLAVLGIVIGLQLWRLRRACPTRGERRRRAIRGIASLVIAATATFAIIQWALVPWLTSQTTNTPPGSSLP
jgi:hypothetical protein